MILAPLLGWLLTRIYKKEDASWRDWSLLIFLALFTHALLDCFTTWGTQLFWPLDYRIAWQSIFVIDPVYTVPFLVCVVWLMFKDRKSLARRNLNLIGLTLSTLYLCLTLVNKERMNRNFESILKSQNIAYSRYETKPTPLNNILWAVTAETESGFYIGYHSFLDRTRNVPLFFFPKNHNRLTTVEQADKIRKLLAITNGYYTVEAMTDGLLVNDLRFGQGDGWTTGDGDFVFSYEIRNSGTNSHQEIEITRRANSLRLGARMLAQFWERIKGV